MRDINLYPVNHLVDPHGRTDQQLLGMIFDIRINFRREITGNRFALFLVIDRKSLDHLFRLLEGLNLSLNRPRIRRKGCNRILNRLPDILRHLFRTVQVVIIDRSIGKHIANHLTQHRVKLLAIPFLQQHLLGQIGLFFLELLLFRNNRSNRFHSLLSRRFQFFPGQTINLNCILLVGIHTTMSQPVI